MTVTVASAAGPDDARRRGWRIWALAGLALAIGWAVLAVWTPPEDPAWTVCLFRRITHHDCATCGMTRALAALAKGDVATAQARHPLALPLAIEGLLAWVLAPWAIARGWRAPARWRDGWLIAHGMALAVVFVARWPRGG